MRMQVRRPPVRDTEGVPTPSLTWQPGERGCFLIATVSTSAVPRSLAMSPVRAAVT